MGWLWWKSKTRNESDFSEPIQADVIRSVQKDEYYCNDFQHQVEELVKLLFPNNFINVRYCNEVKYLSQFVYYFITNFFFQTTIGEEYCDLIPIWGGKKILTRRKVLVALMIYFPQYLLAKALQSPTIVNEHPKLHRRLTLIHDKIIPSALRLHLFYFFLMGGSMQLLYRVFGMKYLTTASKLEKKKNYVFLGLLGLHLLWSARTLILSHQKNTSPISPLLSSPLLSSPISPISPISPLSPLHCIYCTTAVQSPSSLPCGHIFCWNCVLPWLLENPYCPICRSPSYPQQVLTIPRWPS